MNDLISRQALCEYALNQKDKSITPNDIMRFPSAQPEKRTEKRTETHACDLISRQAAINAHYEYCNKHPDAGFPVWSLKILEDLPSAQPEIIHCRECKHWKQQTNYAGAPLSFGFCESDDMWRSLYGETYEVSHIDTDDDFYCGFAERRTDDG